MAVMPPLPFALLVATALKELFLGQDKLRG